MDNLNTEESIYKSMEKYAPHHLSIDNYHEEFLISLYALINSSKSTHHILEELEIMIHNLVDSKKTNELILVCNISIDITSRLFYHDSYYLWKAYYNIGLGYYYLGFNEASIEAIEKSITHIDTDVEVNLEYAHSLWLLSVVYFHMGYETECIGIYKKLLKYYKLANRPVYRIGCLFNIAEISRNTKKMILLIKILENLETTKDGEDFEYKYKLLNQMYTILREKTNS